MGPSKIPPPDSPWTWSTPLCTLTLALQARPDGPQSQLQRHLPRIPSLGTLCIATHLSSDLVSFFAFQPSTRPAYQVRHQSLIFPTCQRHRGSPDGT